MSTAADCSGLVAAGFGFNSYVCTILQTFQVLTNASDYIPDTFPSYEAQDGDLFDFIIVGGGTAGSIMASRLSEIAEWKVLLVEGGGDPPQISSIPGMFMFIPFTGVDYAFQSEPDGWSSQSLNQQRVVIPSGKMLGGSSNLDHIIYKRGTEADLNAWVKLLNLTGWDYKSILPYYKLSERNYEQRIINGPTAYYHNTTGWMSVSGRSNNTAYQASENNMLQFYKELGIEKIWDINVAAPNGTSSSSYRTTSDSYRSSASHSILYPASNRSNLYIMKNTEAIKILFDNNKTAIGVKVVTANGNTLDLLALKEVILSAGTINSPKLLMLSGVGPKGHLKALGIDVIADLPVGKNYHDHISVPMVTAGATSEYYDLATTAANADGTTMPLPFTSATFSMSASRAPDLQLFSLVFGSNSSLFLYLLHVDFNYNEELVQSHLNNFPDRELYLTFVTLTKMSSRGNVTLKSSNYTDTPIIYTGFLSDETDYDVYVDAVKLFYKIQNTTYFTKVGGAFSKPYLPNCASYTFASDEYWKCYIREQATTTFHPVGTCAMGSVTNAELKVIEVNNMRVIDDSVIPIAPNGKTLAMTTMIAEKGADLIKKTYGFDTYL